MAKEKQPPKDQAQLPLPLPIKKIPDINEIYYDVVTAAKNTELNRLLNQEPKAEWIRTNKFANNSKYIPVGTIEYLLTSVFTKWKLEIKQVQVIANSVVVSIRLHVLDPVTNEWDWQDGVGGAPIQTESGAAATDFSKVTNLAVQMAAPAAEVFAMKDAAEKFGRLFGKDLNRFTIETNYVIDQLTRKEERLKAVAENLTRLMNTENKK
jgi:hypothetical protein